MLAQLLTKLWGGVRPERLGENTECVGAFPCQCFGRLRDVRCEDLLDQRADTLAFPCEYALTSLEERLTARVGQLSDQRRSHSITSVDRLDWLPAAEQRVDLSAQPVHGFVG
jgi:hypothetical protein